MSKTQISVMLLMVTYVCNKGGWMETTADFSQFQKSFTSRMHLISPSFLLTAWGCSPREWLRPVAHCPRPLQTWPLPPPSSFVPTFNPQGTFSPTCQIVVSAFLDSPNGKPCPGPLVFRPVYCQRLITIHLFTAVQLTSKSTCPNSKCNTSM